MVEVLSQFNITIFPISVNKHCNADELGRSPDETQYYDCHKASENLEDLPFKGCSYAKEPNRIGQELNGRLMMMFLLLKEAA